MKTSLITLFMVGAMFVADIQGYPSDLLQFERELLEQQLKQLDTATITDQIKEIMMKEEFKRQLGVNAASPNICEIDDDIKKKLMAFRFRKAKTNAAIILKIDEDTLKVVEDDSFEDMDPDTLSTELPSNLPRFVAYSYSYLHDDGRISYPISLIYSAPLGDDSDLRMMYAGCKNELVKEGEFTKVLVVTNPEEIEKIG